MRYRFFAFAALVVTAFALQATSATAVVVENAGPIEISGASFATHTLSVGPELTVMKCVNHWTGEVEADGHVNLDNIDVDPGTGTVGNCANIDDCNSAGWEGQIEEDHPDWEYSFHLTYCFAGQGGPFDGVPVTIECQIVNSELHCGGTHDGTADANENESFIGNFTVAPGIVLSFFSEGELSVTDVLGLMHE